ncbi:glycosyltransferase family 4 protein [Luteimonas sp. A649]
MAQARDGKGAAPALRILVFANLAPWVLGGAEHQTARLVERWCQMGAHVEVVGSRIPDGVASLGSASVRTHRLRTIRGSGRGLRGGTYLTSLLAFAWRNRGRFDVAYCRGLSDAALGLSLAKRMGLVKWPFMAVPINAHGNGDANFLRSVPAWPMWRSLLDGQLGRVNLINGDMAAELDALGLLKPPRSRVPNGIEVHPPIIRRNVSRPRRVLWTGRFEHQKGLDLLIEALHWNRGLAEACVVELYGDGPLRNQIVEHVEARGLGRIVRFGGVVDKEKIRATLATADAFVLPSRYEGMSNSALEAMEAGLPVLCTSCGGIDLAVRDGAGWVCAAGDLISLGDGLRDMLSATDDDWLARGRKARLLVEQRFQIDEVAARNLMLLRELAEARL